MVEKRFKIHMMVNIKDEVCGNSMTINGTVKSDTKEAMIKGIDKRLKTEYTKSFFKAAGPLTKEDIKKLLRHKKEAYGWKQKKIQNFSKKYGLDADDIIDDLFRVNKKIDTVFEESGIGEK
jgi:hypothetical protein